MLQADDGRFAEFEHAMIARNVRFRDAVAEISPLPTDRGYAGQRRVYRMMTVPAHAGPRRSLRCARVRGWWRTVGGDDARVSR